MCLAIRLNSRCIQIDEQRRYLGGDSEHSILVKGLDMALLQQNKAKAATATDEDESLEQAYTQSASEPIVSSTKKRTREEIIRELKAQRAQRGESNPVEDPTLNKNKFKPIGFKPIGGSVEQKKIKKKIKGDGERKKKRRKVELSADDKSAKSMATVEPTSSTTTVPKSPRLLELEELQPPEEFDIFAGVGDYEGVNDDDDDESEGEGEGEEKEKTEEVISRSLRPGQWFVTDEQMGKSPSIEDKSPSGPTPGPSVSHPPPIEEAQASDEEQLTRLVPLSSSAVPSIKELLAIDEAAEAADKKHKRKNKKKGGDGAGSKKLDAEAKANRDYQRSVVVPSKLEIFSKKQYRLKSYTDKRGDE